MILKYSPGQKLKLNKRCVLAGTVPSNSLGYHHAVLVLGEGDEYAGDGVLEEGTEVLLIDYARHGTETAVNPLINVRGKLAVCHQKHLDLP